MNVDHNIYKRFHSTYIISSQRFIPRVINTLAYLLYVSVNATLRVSLQTHRFYIIFRVLLTFSVRTFFIFYSLCMYGSSSRWIRTHKCDTLNSCDSMKPGCILFYGASSSHTRFNGSLFFLLSVRLGFSLIPTNTTKFDDKFDR